MLLQGGACILADIKIQNIQNENRHFRKLLNISNDEND